LLRLLALAATVQFVSAAAAVAVSTVAWQAAGRPGMLPGWMGWYGAWTAGWRIALALAAVAALVAALWWLSVMTASSYEARTSSVRPRLAAAWPLTQPGFWKGEALVGRQRALHAAAACAAIALIAALPSGHPAVPRWVAIGIGAAALAAAACTATLPMSDRQKVTLAHGGKPPGRGKDAWCRSVLAAAIAALLSTVVVAGCTERQHGPQAGALPGLTGFLAVLLTAQAVLLAMLAITVVVLARRARTIAGNGPAGDDDVPPYLGGNLAALVAALGVGLGGLLSAIISLGVVRLLGTPVPSGFRFGPARADALSIPWPLYAFATAPVGLLCGTVIAAIVLFRRYQRRCATFQARGENNPSPVAGEYASATAGPPGTSGDNPEYASNRGAIAKAWAIGLIADDAGTAAALSVGGALIVVLAGELAAAMAAGSAGHPVLIAGWLHGLASLVTLLGIVTVGWLIRLLRQAYSNPAKRKTIAALWDVTTFWPRAVHPLAPPCYAERAIPEVVDRIRLLTGHLTSEPEDTDNLLVRAGQPDLPDTRGLTVPARPVLLTGYSQGSIIAPAVIAQLPPDVLPDVALLTLACPARRLYGRAFPAYFGRRQLTELASMLDATTKPSEEREHEQSAGRWKNLRRRSDYIGSWIFAEPEPELTCASLESNIDQPCRDPVILVPDANRTPPPIHSHYQWWPDPRTGEVGTYLTGLLAKRRPVRHAYRLWRNRSGRWPAVRRSGGRSR
jgi:hypothetical protein